MRTILSNQKNVVRRSVIGENPVITIKNTAAWRNQRDFANTVLLGAVGVITGVHHLMVPESKEKNNACSGNDGGEKPNSPLQDVDFFTLLHYSADHDTRGKPDPMLC